jgi:hypothetical protein
MRPYTPKSMKNPKGPYAPSIPCAHDARSISEYLGRTKTQIQFRSGEVLSSALEGGSGLRQCAISPIRARDLADQILNGHRLEMLTLPIDAAHCKAREIIGQSPQGGFLAVIEKWRQLSDGRIEFAIRHLPTSD